MDLEAYEIIQYITEATGQPPVASVIRFDTICTWPANISYHVNKGILLVEDKTYKYFLSSKEVIVSGDNILMMASLQYAKMAVDIVMRHPQNK